MSIIYNALQKTQAALSEKTAAPVASEPTVAASPVSKDEASRRDYLLLSVAALLVLVAGMTMQQHWPAPAQKQVALVKPLPPVVMPSLVVNGIFLSAHDTMAIVNQKTLHIGDSISGMRVVGINLQGVRLQDHQHAVLLPSSA